MKVLVALETKFAIRSGGHKPAPGFNSIGSDGVLIALQNLNKLAISADKKTVTTGTGNRWRDVYGFVEPHGVIVVGGRVDMVGVGGYMLGGMNLTQNLESHYDLSPWRQVVSVSFQAPGVWHWTVYHAFRYAKVYRTDLCLLNNVKGCPSGWLYCGRYAFWTVRGSLPRSQGRHVQFWYAFGHYS